MKKMSNLIVGLGFVLVLVGCQKNEDQTRQLSGGAASQEVQSDTPDPTTGRTAQQEDAYQAITSSKTLADQIALLKPHMEDATDKMPPTAMGIPLWSQQHDLTWKELNEIPATTYGRVMKDSDAENGKRLCVTGMIAEIAADRSAGFTIFAGGIINDDMSVFRFLAIKSSGDIVEQSSARFCGIVNGILHYGNSVGGITHAPYLVGMFDLPENKK